jgi:hypothetical protein
VIIDRGEVIDRPLYDFQPLQGVAKQEFFQVPVGVEGKTRFDTNMLLVGQLPSGVTHSTNQIEVAYFPQGPDQRQQYEDFGRLGRLEVTVLDKMYFDLAPLGRFMRPWRYVEDGGVLVIDEAPWTHGPFRISVPFTLLPAQSFGVTVAWDNSARAVAGGRLGVILHGYMQRPSQ